MLSGAGGGWIKSCPGYSPAHEQFSQDGKWPETPRGLTDRMSPAGQPTHPSVTITNDTPTLPRSSHHIYGVQQQQ